MGRYCIQALLRAPPDRDIDLGIDASYVTKAVSNRVKLERSYNGDLWSILFTIIDSRSATTNIFEIDSHLDEKGPVAIQEKMIKLSELVGNTLADEVAGAVAAHIKPGPTFARGQSLGTLVAPRRLRLNYTARAQIEKDGRYM